MILEEAISQAFDSNYPESWQKIALRAIAQKHTDPIAPEAMREGARRELRLRVSSDSTDKV